MHCWLKKVCKLFLIYIMLSMYINICYKLVIMNLETQLKYANRYYSHAYSNSCNWGSNPLNCFQSSPRKAQLCMTRIWFYNRIPAEGIGIKTIYKKFLCLKAVQQPMQYVKLQCALHIITLSLKVTYLNTQKLHVWTLDLLLTREEGCRVDHNARHCFQALGT